jgi:S1-C subfamily serine protease
MRRLIALLTLVVISVMGGVAAAQDDAPPFIGIGFSPDGASGVVVTQVVEGSPAEDAGLQNGDVIVTLGGDFVTAQNLGALVQEYSVGDTVTLGVLREGEVQEIDVTLGERPEETAGVPPIPERLETLDVPAPSTRLGVAVDVTEDASGAAVINVVDPSPAARAGIEVGDVITAVNGETVEDPTQLVDVIGSYEPRDVVEIEVRRDGETETIEVELGVRPVEIATGGDDAPQQPFGMEIPEVTGITFNPEDNTWTVDSDELGEFNLEQGDVITEVAGEPVENPDQLFEALSGAMVEDNIPVTVIRDGEETEIQVPVDVIIAMLATFQQE